jgi:hypothetical protein
MPSPSGLGADDPFNGHYVGSTCGAQGDKYLLVVKASIYGRTHTPTLSYFVKKGVIRAIPDTTANFIGIGYASIIFTCDSHDPVDYIGSIAFNTTSFYNYKEPAELLLLFNHAVCTVAADKPLSCYDKYCNHCSFGEHEAGAECVLRALGWQGPGIGLLTHDRNATYCAVRDVQSRFGRGR